MKILIVDDEEAIRKATAVALEAMGHEAFKAPNSRTALAILAQEPVHVVFLDLVLGIEDGLEVLPQLLAGAPGLSVVVFTAHASVETAVEAMKLGATDFIEKPFTPDQIRAVLGRIEKSRRLQERVEELEDRLAAEQPASPSAWSRSAVMRKIYAVAEKAARSEAGILILGEHGTGKSVLGHQIHLLSDRRDARYVTVTCPSVSPDRLASEIFGHVRGAFAGAAWDSWGKVSLAEGGTLFLDEIGDLPLEVQPSILRLIQEKRFERVGESVTRPADVRIIAATHRDLKRDVAEGTFREDLFYRLNVISISLPPLRERMEDIETLVQTFVSRFARQCGKHVQGFSEAAWKWIRQYHWPGNLRELRNFVERQVILADSEMLDIDWETRRNADNSSPDGAPASPRVQVGQPVTLQELQDAHIQKILESAPTMDAAARILGIDPATLYRRRKRLAPRS